MNLTQHDLEFILKQIKIAETNSEAHAGENARPLTEIWVDGQGSPVDADGNPYQPGAAGTVQALSSSLHPYGLRTVNGSYNNFIVDREMYGASGQPFVRLTDPHWVEGTGSPG